ncbi:hypothetical protein BJ138DRAFT_289051 [Hygrophoropsis aurantiaca]|uniref:Uncharacterized protein n=1 Tax=Hygrophoropsis aurantiaca TaxID=72124 RepID=A0ACB8ATJ5_9AGAM|nr:hypothetical protein BJ138DRAFT_289051 [Hygrophoropsis aurantiaca]
MGVSSTEPSSDDTFGSTKTGSVKQDETFYFNTVVFLVEDTLFRVPRHPFIDGSDLFRQMFELPVPDGAQEDGSSDEHPLRLEQIKQTEFRQLLKVLFPDYTRSKKLPKSFAEWRSVLRLSTMWGFDNARDQAIKSIGAMTMDPVDKISLAKDYDVDEWLVPAIHDLVKRKEPIGVKDVEKLGLDLALKVAAIRERLTTTHSSYPLQIGDRQVSHLDFTASIQTMLGPTIVNANV